MAPRRKATTGAQPKGAVTAVPDRGEGAKDPGPLEGEELFIALVYPVGTDAVAVLDTLRDALTDVNYESSNIPIRLIEELERTDYGKAKLATIQGDDKKKKDYEGPEYFRRYMEMMELGTSFRRDAKAGDKAMGLFAATRILEQRLEAGGIREPHGAEDALMKTVRSRYAYLIRSLKVPDEIASLRNTYGDALIVIAAHSDEDARRRNLTWKIANSDKKPGLLEEYRPHADRLITRDYREGRQGGQRLEDAFPLADVFVDASHPQRLEDSIKRFIEILFRHRFRTPTRDEYGMFHAYGAALRSADLSRQVGASITDDDGEVIALGTNEVPKADGGLYWPGDLRDDGRDFTFRRDVATEIKKRALDEFLQRLREGGHLDNAEVGVEDVWGDLQGTQFMDVGEFGRATHAEMGAIVHAARRGRSIQGCTLYTTTFPCHVCARHIVQAGIKRVVFNEPYPKSLAELLHADSIVIGGPGAPHRVLFEPFVGVSPALYGELFRVPKGLRLFEGQIPTWERARARPSRVADPNSYIPKEVDAADELRI